MFRKFAFLVVLATIIFGAIPREACSLTVTSGPMQELMFKEGKRHYDAGDFAKAQEVWSNIFPGTPFGPVCYLLLERAWTSLGENAKAESLIREFLKRHPESVYRNAAREALVDCLCRQGRAEAKPMLNSMLERASEKDKPELILRLAELERRMSDHSAAAAHYRTLFLKYPATVEGLQAAEDIARMVFNGKIPRMLFSPQEEMARGDALFAKGRFDLALESYQAVFKLRDADKGLMLKIGRCYHKDRKDQKAIAILKDVLRGDVSEKDRMAALHLLSLVYWRLDKDKDFELCSNELAEKAPVDLKRKALFNLAAYHFEKHRFDAALSDLDRLLKTRPDASLSAQAKWKKGWIKYSTEKFTDAADAFREVRHSAASGDLPVAAKYWQARSLISAKRPREAQPLLKELAESIPYRYYGIEAARSLKSMKVESNLVRKNGKSFPDIRLSPEDKKQPLVVMAEKLMDFGLHDFALMNLIALPGTKRSSPAMAFLIARAAHGGHHYKAALDVLSGPFGAFMEDPPADAPGEFIEMAYPRIYFAETVRLAQKHSVDPHLIWAIIRQESRYDADAVSPAGALGLMQVTPGAAGFAGSKARVPATAIAEILNPRKNLEFGVRVLAKNLSSFQGRVVPAVASYNADIRKVRGWVQRNGKMDQDEFIEHIPFRETRLYVKKVLAGYTAYAYLHKKKDLAGLW